MALHEPHSASGAGTALTEVGRLASQLARAEEDHLLKAGSLVGDPHAALARQAEAAVARAIEDGASLEDVHRAVLPAAGPLARRRATGMLIADAAALGFVEDHLIASSEGEVPVAHVSRLRTVLTATRRDFDAAVRRAMVGGLAADEIIAIAQDAGIELAALDVVLALQGVTGD